MKGHFLYPFFLLCFLLFNRAYSSEPCEDKQNTRFLLGLVGGVNLFASITGPGGLSKNRIAPVVGLRSQWFLTDSLGLFIGADYVNRGVELQSRNIATSSFIDIPLGFAYRFDSKFTGQFGVLFSTPLGDLKTEQLFIQPTKNFIGLYAEATILFYHWLIFKGGLSLWAKGGLQDAFIPWDLGRVGKIIEVGLGLAFQLGSPTEPPSSTAAKPPPQTE